VYNIGFVLRASVTYNSDIVTGICLISSLASTGHRIVVNLCTYIETTEVTVTLADFMPKLEHRGGS
jgi:hypothetical protein